MTLEVDIVKVYQLKEGSAMYNNEVGGPKAVIDMIYPLYKNLDREMAAVVGLDIRNCPTMINTVSIGSLDSSLVYPREVFKPLILSNSRSFIMVHNHPSGYLVPSNADIDLTKRLRSLGKEMMIELHDHLILGSPQDYTSFRQQGIVFE